MATAALVVMTILGCDDSVSQCHYVDAAKGRWETVAACDAQSQTRLPSYANANYPVIVAMCEKTQDEPAARLATTISPAIEPPPANSAAPSASLPSADGFAESSPTLSPEIPQPPPVRLPQRAYALLKGALPDGQRLKQAIGAPVHYITDSYSWIARKVAP